MEQLDYHMLYRQFCAPAGGGLLLLRRSQSKRKCFCARDANAKVSTMSRVVVALSLARTWEALVSNSRGLSAHTLHSLFQLLANACMAASRFGS